MGQDIEIQTKAKYLGVWIDEHLNWTTQVNQVCTQGYITLKICGKFHPN